MVPVVLRSFSSPSPARRASGLTRRSSNGGWTHEEDASLARLVKHFDGKNWKRIEENTTDSRFVDLHIGQCTAKMPDINELLDHSRGGMDIYLKFHDECLLPFPAEAFPGRTDIQCLRRWQKVLNPELVKGCWTEEEDECIIKQVAKHGCKRWSVIAKSLPGRMGKQCRERWHNHLNPAIKRGAWALEEEVMLIRCHQKYGNKWAEIAKSLPGRTENSIKNHWNCSLKKKSDYYSSYDVLNQQSGMTALSWKDCMRKVGCSEIIFPGQGVGELGTCFISQNLPSTRAKAMTLQPPVGNGGNTGAANSSLKHLNLLIHQSPCASAQSPSSCNSSCSSDMLLCHESETRHRDDESFASSSYLRPLQMKGTTNLSHVPCSTPTSPTSFLRSAAESFKNTPSIVRKRKSSRESSKVLFVDC